MSIHVMPGENDDWIVREAGGRELGHYPTQEAALAVGSKLARKRKVELLAADARGRVTRSRPGGGWWGRFFGRG
jgi:hypothetical protein